MRLPATVRFLAGRLVRWHGVVGLNYHRLGDGRQSLFDRGLWSATAEGFEKQIRYLRKNFDVITPREIKDAVGKTRGRHVLVTFDDGYVDNYATAFPILMSEKVKASFFITTGFIDKRPLAWWDEIAWMVRTSQRSEVNMPSFLPFRVKFKEPDREEAVRMLLRTYFALPIGQTSGFLDAVADATGTGRLPSTASQSHDVWMTWDMIREMHAAGMTIGGHTVSHPILSRLSPQEQLDEIAGCKRRLGQELGVPMHTFAYPYGIRGSFNDASRECLRNQGVTSAFSYYGGITPLSNWDYYDIPRIAIEQTTTFEEFRAAVMCPWVT